MGIAASRAFRQIHLKQELMGLPFRMRPFHLCFLLWLGAFASAWAVAPTEVTQWRTGLTELDEGWAGHDGDDHQWARPDFDDSKWSRVNLEDQGPAKDGWHWFRQHV